MGVGPLAVRHLLSLGHGWIEDKGSSFRPHSRRVWQGMAYWQFVVDKSMKPIPQLTTRAMQPTADRTHGNTQNRTDLVIAEPVKLFHHHHGAMVRSQCIERVLNDPIALGALKGERRLAFPRIERWLGHRLAEP